MACPVWPPKIATHIFRIFVFIHFRDMGYTKVPCILFGSLRTKLSNRAGGQPPPTHTESESYGIMLAENRPYTESESCGTVLAESSPFREGEKCGTALLGNRPYRKIRKLPNRTGGQPPLRRVRMLPNRAGNYFCTLLQHSPSASSVVLRSALVQPKAATKRCRTQLRCYGHLVGSPPTLGTSGHHSFMEVTET